MAPHLEYSGEQVHCMICANIRKTGIGGWISQKNLKAHLGTSTHLGAYGSEMQRVLTEAKEQEQLSGAYSSVEAQELPKVDASEVSVELEDLEEHVSCGGDALKRVATRPRLYLAIPTIIPRVIHFGLSIILVYIVLLVHCSAGGINTGCNSTGIDSFSLQFTTHPNHIDGLRTPSVRVKLCRAIGRGMFFPLFLQPISKCMN